MFFKFCIKYLFFGTCPLYDNFFKMVKLINLGKDKKKNKINTITNKINQARYKVLFIQAFFLVYSFQSILGAFFTNNLPDMVNFALCNMLFIEDLSPRYYLWVAANLNLTVYVVYLMYFSNNGTTFNTAYSICKHSKDDFFIQSKGRICWRNVLIVNFIRHRLIPFFRFYLVITQSLTCKL